jgi:hypothetical protein
VRLLAAGGDGAVAIHRPPRLREGAAEVGSIIEVRPMRSLTLHVMGVSCRMSAIRGSRPRLVGG